MAYDKKFKISVKAYFESHMDAPKEVAKRFNVKERTMRHWVETEGWKMGFYLKGKKLRDVKTEIATEKVREIFAEAKEKFTEEIKAELVASKRKGELDGLLDDEFIGEVSEHLIYSAMTEGYLNKELSTTMLIARNIFHQNVALNPANPANMMLAKDYAGMVRDFKKSLYNNEPSNVINIHNVGTIKQDDLSSMSDDDLRRLIELESQIKE